MKFQTGAVFSVALAVSLLAWTSTASASHSPSGQDRERDFTYQPATGLVNAVREATAKYQDVANATADGYGPVLGCVSGPDMGAMGVHYLKPELLGDDTVDAAHPELLVYEPQRNGRLQLVAVEYIVFADAWDASHTDGSPPSLMGQLFNHTDAPNRFRLPANYSLHVWAWKFNPAGVFSMWNPRVSCGNFTE